MPASEPPSTPPASPDPEDGGRATSSFLNDVISDVLPEAADPDPRRRNRRVLMRAGWAALTALFAFTLTKGCDWLTAEHDAQVASDADDKVDLSGPAFTSSVRLDAGTTPPDAYLFDAPFSPQEKRTLLAMGRDDGALTPFVEAHHGRGVLGADPVRARPTDPAPLFSQTWLVDILSDRKAGLVINGLRMKGLTCTPAKAAAVIVRKGQAGGSYEGMFFDVSRSAGTPFITGEEEGRHYGKPFFQYKKIDLGNGAAPEGLRVQVTSWTQDCTWKAFEATYVDTQGTHTQDITDNGKGFRVRGVAAPSAQVFELRTAGPFVRQCHWRDVRSYDC
ncbi:hypothetical protein [Streptomyces sp. NPDC048521]|uniref:hypothetical protein n=1 Tax=Streptomyces sp. NPDC048521 TaxID=3365566 RepID=UPI003713C2F8